MDLMTSSTCNRFRKILEGQRHDRAGELPDELALHLDRCGECRRQFDASRLELDPAAFERLSEERRQKIMGALAAARSVARRRRSSLTAAAATAAVIAVVVALVLHLGTDGGGTVATLLVEDHIRYLRHPDRRSSDDQATVVTDLEAYVDFPIRLPDLPGSELTGSRGCYLLGRRVGLVFYETPAGPVSYFVLDASGLTVPGEAYCLVNGYRVVSWEVAGLLHAVVGSDSRALQTMAGAARKAFLEP